MRWHFFRGPIGTGYPGGNIGNVCCSRCDGRTGYIHIAHLVIRKTPRSFNTQDKSCLVYNPISHLLYCTWNIFWEEVFLSDSFDPKLTSFLIQIRARMYMYNMYSIHSSTGRRWKLFLGSTTKSSFSRNWKFFLYKFDFEKFYSHSGHFS